VKVINTVSLKNHANKVLKQVMKGNAVIITYRGRPAASLTRLTEDDLEDFVLENSPKIRKMIAEAEKDLHEGQVRSFDKYLANGNADVQDHPDSPRNSWPRKDP
jgi:antitoxin (DNA-binding transcriptional repressor) of toxin-antitoxin stability system